MQSYQFQQALKARKQTKLEEKKECPEREL